jgi:hypothetical protein
MVEPRSGARPHVQATGSKARPVLADTLQALERLQLFVDVVSDPPTQFDWLGAADLVSPEREPLAGVLQSFKAAGIAVNRRAAAASLLLRFGWSAGFAVTAYLARARVPIVRDYALFFSPASLLKAVWIRDAQFVGRPDDAMAGGPEWADSVSDDALREHLLQSLVAHTEPVVVAMREWSGYSRHALWAMVTSSWAAQFANVARQLGDEGRGVHEARAIFALDPEVSRAAPRLYEVSSEGLARTCQVLRACCLYYKSPGRRFCANCPIIPESERLERNRTWVAAQQPQPATHV